MIRKTEGASPSFLSSGNLSRKEGKTFGDETLKVRLGVDVVNEEKVFLKFKSPRIGFVCGKRGMGKSFTLGVISDQLSRFSDVLVIDTMGVMKIYTEGEAIKAPEDLKLPLTLVGESLLFVFDLSSNSPQGILLTRAINDLKRSFYTIRDLIERVEIDETSSDTTKRALINRLLSAQDWGIFQEYPSEISFLFEGYKVLDLSLLRYELRQLVVWTLCDVLLVDRMKERREKHIYMVIDEAQDYAPSRASEKNSLVRLAKEGRLPGIGAILASQQPSAISSGVLSQVDFLIAHKLTLVEDIKALRSLTPTFMKGDMGVYMRKLRDPGDAVFIDDVEEDFRILKVRRWVDEAC
ncbi:ATP-binding protein [Thermotoga sp. SG1]|uniref:ATP-binding protein n=1 Tax=Thermotoga sp. SG1 TaxID=126739 RepID=UPI000C768E25|nr:ATP-binding protein [Thermotoga sp. SG1]PLV55749.1 hypothetical protein AS006_08945 [Thermotoga sp. SG1]